VVQKRNPQAEQWTGRRLGVEGVQKNLGIATVINGEDFKKLSIDFTTFDKIIFDRIPLMFR
jgi:Xaa-Pro aminopeptidase